MNTQTPNTHYTVSLTNPVATPHNKIFLYATGNISGTPVIPYISNGNGYYTNITYVFTESISVEGTMELILISTVD